VGTKLFTLEDIAHTGLPLDVMRKRLTKLLDGSPKGRVEKPKPECTPPLAGCGLSQNLVFCILVAKILNEKKILKDLMKLPF
jgi:hypothetical protein